VTALCFGPVFARAEVVPLSYPDFTDTTIANGLRILVAEHHEQPAIFYRLLVKAGGRDEPAGKEGLAELTASLLDQGTASHTAEEIAEIIDGIGGKLWVSAGEENTTIGCDVLAPDSTTGLDLFSNIVLEPVFPKKELVRAEQRMIQDIKQSFDSPAALAHRHVRNLLFGAGSRLGRDKTEKSVTGITTDDLRGFYRSWFLPNNAILLVVGNFSKAAMLRQLIQRFGSWPVGKLANREAASPAGLAEKKIRLVNKPDLTQGSIVIAGWGIDSRNPDRPAFQIMDRILVGGSFSSRLFAVIRVKEGKTYDISSQRELHPDFGLWGIWTFTRSDEVVKTYTSIVTELKKFIDQGVTEEELQKAKSSLLGSIPLRLESPRAIADRVLDGVYNGFTIDDLRHETIDLDKVTREDVNRVAKRYLSSDAFVLVIVGNGNKIRKSLGGIGKFEEVNYRAPLGK
jgi:zinc protease